MKELKRPNIKRLSKIKTSQQLQGEKKERYKRWITFYRLNPHIFIEHYLGIKLYPYQKLVIWMLQRSNLFYWVAARAAAKSFLIAVYSVSLAILYPGIRIIVASKTLKQAGIIVADKIKTLQTDYPNVAREIQKLTDNTNTYEVIFHSGSKIEAVVSTENSRGKRCNYLILDESRLVPKDILDGVLRPFLFSRTPPYMLKPEYAKRKELKEDGIISYITSAGFKQEYWFSMVKKTIRRMIDGDTTANFLAVDFLITLYHGIKTREMIRNEASDMDDLTRQMEYLNIPAGASGKAYYKLGMFKRNLKRAFYPQRDDTYNSKKNPYGIDKVAGEMRLISIDVATRAGKANDNTIITCARLIPVVGKGYKRQLVYTESHNGKNELLQAKRIKEVFFDFEADYIVLDLKNSGIGIYDALTQVTTSDERGIDFEAMTIVDDDDLLSYLDDKAKEDLSERTLGVEPLPVIFPISATQIMNSQIAVSFRSALQKGMWEFLIGDMEAEEFLINHEKDFLNNMGDSQMRMFYLNPYIQTNLLIGECISLDMKLVSGNIKLEEKEGARKDRFSSISYLNWIAKIFDAELLKENSTKGDLEFLLGVTKIYH